MWKKFVPSSFRINQEQQCRIENFIGIGDAFIQNLNKFSHQEKDFKNNLDWHLSKQRERAQHKREKEKLENLRGLEKKREQEEEEKNEKKKRDEQEKAKEEKLRKVKEENERKEYEEREKLRQGN